MATTSEYEVPTKAIISPAQLQQFQQSATHASVLAYIETLNEAVVGVKLRDNCHESEVIGIVSPNFTRIEHVSLLRIFVGRQGYPRNTR
jgi:serine/threonine-protein phosphatase 2A activator